MSMFSRRRATPEELAQGEREMLAAQKPLVEETATRDEKPIEDVKEPEGTDSFESPKASQWVKEAEGSEEKHAGSPKSFAPPLPVQDAPQVKPAETKVTPSASPAQVKSDPKMPAPALGTPSESHGAVVSRPVMDVNAPKGEQNAQVVPMVQWWNRMCRVFAIYLNILVIPLLQLRHQPVLRSLRIHLCLMNNK